jgi:hypothetical protein
MLKELMSVIAVQTPLKQLFVSNKKEAKPPPFVRNDGS